MKLTYKELEIELELAGLLAVEELVLTQGLNCHAGLTLKILIEEEQRDELVTMSSDAGVTVRELEKTNGQVVFRGKLETVSARRENGLFLLIPGSLVLHDGLGPREKEPQLPERRTDIHGSGTESSVRLRAVRCDGSCDGRGVHPGISAAV